jgi:hypothetical protein
MTGRTAALVGLCLLLLSAFSAQSVFASKGTTAFTCRNVGGGSQEFKDAHCKEATGGGNFAHIAVAEGTKTEATASNEKTAGETTETTPAKLKSVIAGIEFEISAAGAHGEGFVTNAKDPITGEHYAHGTGSIVFTGVEVIKPTGKGCKVFTDEGGKKGKEGTVDSRLLKATTKEQGDFVKLEPDEGNVVATYFVECTVKMPALEGIWEVLGSFKGVPSRATLNFTDSEITAQNTLKSKGVKAGIEGSFTISGRDTASGDVEFSPISATTVETP